MRLLITLLLITGFITLPAYSKEYKVKIHDYSAQEEKIINNDIKVPEFDEFAPVGYESRKPNSEFLTGIEKGFAKFFNSTKIGIPIGEPMLEHAKLREKNNLWANRKRNFEASLSYCKAMTTKKEVKSCYTKIRRVELYKNADKKTGQIRLESGY